MQSSPIEVTKDSSVKVIHDLKRRVLEVLSLLRVMNNYYQTKNKIQEQIQPFIIKKFKEGLEAISKKTDWLFSIPIALNTLTEDFLNKKDSFRFPDSIILFEAWMNLGLAALYPRVVLHFKFPGIRKGERTRNVFQFIFSTSRGFGFPIYFGPEFYKYTLSKIKYLEPLLKWVYTVNHRANQAIVLVNRRLKSKRHHPGEFESVIISEYNGNIFKATDTLLHGFYTGVPKYLGKFSYLDEALQHVYFSYTIGDHAMSVNTLKTSTKAIPVVETPLINHESIVKRYDIDFYSYIKKLMNVNNNLTKKVLLYKQKRKDLICKLSLANRLRFFILKIFKAKNVFQKFNEITQIENFIFVINIIKELLWTTPLYSHTIHLPTDKKMNFDNLEYGTAEDEVLGDTSDSILLTAIKKLEKIKGISFKDKDVIENLKDLRDHMAKMWLYFKERHFRYAVKRLDEIASLSIENKDYSIKINNFIDKLLPIFSIYEIFNRPLAESVYPESSPNINRIGKYLARFFSSKYNPLGINLMNIFNKLAFYNWIYLIKNQRLSYRDFFSLILKLPIWKDIPPNIKDKILSYD